jgi:hypothetical protein
MLQQLTFKFKSSVACKMCATLPSTLHMAFRFTLSLHCPTPWSCCVASCEVGPLPHPRWVRACVPPPLSLIGHVRCQHFILIGFGRVCLHPSAPPSGTNLTWWANRAVGLSVCHVSALLPCLLPTVRPEEGSGASSTAADAPPCSLLRCALATASPPVAGIDSLRRAYSSYSPVVQVH